MKTTTLALASCFLLAACAGREAHPVALVQPQDDTESCTSIGEEVASDQAKIVNLGKQRADHNANNAVVGAIGLVLFAPALFALDTTDYERQEMTAFQERDTHLLAIADKKGCPSVALAATVTPAEAPAPAAAPASAWQASHD